MAEWLFPLPEVSSSNPVTSKPYSEHLFTFNCIGNTKIKKKRFAMALMKQPKKDLDLFKTFLIFLGPTRQTF